MTPRFWPTRIWGCRCVALRCLTPSLVLLPPGAKAWADVLTSPAGGSRLRRLVLSGCEVGLRVRVGVRVRAEVRVGHGRGWG